MVKLFSLIMKHDIYPQIGHLFRFSVVHEKGKFFQIIVDIFETEILLISRDCFKGRCYNPRYHSFNLKSLPFKNVSSG